MVLGPLPMQSKIGTTGPAWGRTSPRPPAGRFVAKGTDSSPAAGRRTISYLGPLGPGTSTADAHRDNTRRGTASRAQPMPASARMVSGLSPRRKRLVQQPGYEQPG